MSMDDYIRLNSARYIPAPQAAPQAATVVSTESAETSADKHVPPVQPVLGSGNADTQDAFESSQWKAEFPSLDVVTRRILKALYQELDEGAREAAQKAAAARFEHVLKTNSSFRPALQPTPGPASGSGKERIPEKGPIKDPFQSVGGRIEKKQQAGQELLAEATFGLSQVSREDLETLHSVAYPMRFFVNQPKSR